VLVVTRKRGEAIVIGDGIEVHVLRLGRDGVRIGITAPPHIAVHRSEVRDQIREANATAATAPSTSAALAQLRSRFANPGKRRDL
jgi:carbon storage regulator